MANACLFIGWNRPFPGQRSEAYGFLMKEGRPLLDKWHQQGWFAARRLYGLTPHMGDLNGCIILEGERAKLDELRRTDEFEKFSVNMSTLFDRYGVVPGVTEEGMAGVRERNPIDGD